MLSILGFIYGKIADVRNALYERGMFASHKLGARTISIGNLTTGGTGKTPLVAYVANILAERGEKVCILTRGYGRANPRSHVLVSDGDQILADPMEAGDEPFELARKLLGKAILIADADRVSAAEWAIGKFGVTVFILDDGFQHRRAKRDLDIVCIDAMDSFDHAKMLPAGHLREPLSNLGRADIIVITRANLAAKLDNLKFQISNFKSKNSRRWSNNSKRKSEDSNLKFQISNFISEIPIFISRSKTARIASLEEFDSKTQSSQSEEFLRKAVAFCGIGNPANFFEQLRQENFVVAATETFRDHHPYSQQDILSIEYLARENEAEILLTTAKDAVKLSNLKFEIPCYVVEIELSLDDEAGFAEML